MFASDSEMHDFSEMHIIVVFIIIALKVEKHTLDCTQIRKGMFLFALYTHQSEPKELRGSFFIGNGGYSNQQKLIFKVFLGPYKGIPPNYSAGLKKLNLH